MYVCGWVGVRVYVGMWVDVCLGVCIRDRNDLKRGTVVVRKVVDRVRESVPISIFVDEKVFF